MFDLLVHRDVYPGRSPELSTFDTAGRGPARPGDPARDVDRRACPEPLQSLGDGTRRLRVLECARYGALLEHSFAKLGWEAASFRAYRVAIAYPLVGRQLTLSFPRGSSGDA